MRIRLDGHLADPDVLAAIAPSLDPDAAEADADVIARIDFHEASHGRERVPGDVAEWTGRMPSIALVREAAPDVMRHYGSTLPPGGITSILRRAQARLRAREDGGTDGRVEVLEHERLHEAFYAVDSVRLRHSSYDGGLSEPLQRYVFVSFDAVIVLPYDSATDRVLVVEQFRMGPFGRGSSNPWMAEPVAGLVDPGEDPETTAIREAEEEAGLRIRKLIGIGGGYTSPGASTGYHHHYIGLCHIPDEVRTGGEETEGEDIRAIPMTADALFARLDAGTMRNVPLMLCTLALRERRAALRA